MDSSDHGPIAAVIVLAAGQGSRMRSSLPKVMHPLAGRPLIWHALQAAGATEPEQIIAVVGHGREQVTEFLASDTAMQTLPLRTAIQEVQRGTGHAVACGIDAAGELTGTVIVTYGDVPLLRGETLRTLAAAHARDGNGVTVLSAIVADPTGYGRIVRDEAGTVTHIVEHRDADEATRAITEINTGIYAFDAAVLTELLPQIGTQNAQSEQYLTDIVPLVAHAGYRVAAQVIADPLEAEGVNDRAQLTTLAAVMRQRLVRAAQDGGVTIHDPASTFIDCDVRVGPDTQIWPSTFLLAGTTIGSGCTIGPDTTLSDCQVADGAAVVRSHCTSATIGENAQVGPYTHLRPGSRLAENTLVGAFVEVKQATIGAGVKSHHLAYLGDAEIGAGSNIGAGVVIANYDGVSKYPTTIGPAAFIGSNATLVAPITVADGAYVAGGSTITNDVPAGDIAVARCKQRNVAGWVARRRAGTPADKAARDAQQQASDAALTSQPGSSAPDQSGPAPGSG